MRTTTRAALAALSLVVMGSVAQAQVAPVKIGYVNTESLMAAAPGRATAESTYNREVVAFQKQQQVWSDSLRKQIEAYQKAEPTLTAAKKTSEQERLQKLQQDLSNLNTLGEQKIRLRENEVLAPLMEIVRAAIEEIRAEGGYAMIFSGDANSPIVAADKNLDLTDRVVSRLKTKAATATAPSAMAPAAVKKPPTQ
jgi:outer membrane protein